MKPRELFDAAYVRTCRGQGVAPDADHADECFRVVQGFSASVYDEAATRLNTSCRWLPKPVEWREACEAVVADQERQERAERDAQYARENEKPETFHCFICHDTGWEPRNCTDKDWCGVCRRARVHLADHRYVTECACRNTNMVYLEKRRKRQDAVRVGPSRDEAARLANKYRGGWQPSMGDAA